MGALQLPFFIGAVKVELIEMQQSGFLAHVEVAVIALFLVAVGLITIFKIYKGIDDRVDARIDARLKPSLDLLKETSEVVKGLQQGFAQMSATLEILKEVMLQERNKK